MIIQCEKCKTRFRLDDSKLSEAGVRVRCSRCSHTFVVRRDAPEEEQDIDSILRELGDAPDGQGEAVEGHGDSEAPHALGLSEGATATAPGPEENESPVWEEEPGSVEDAELRHAECQPEEAFSDLFGTGEGMPPFQTQGDVAEEAVEEAAATEEAAEAESESDARPFADETDADDGAASVEAEAVPPSAAEESVRQSLERVKVDSVPSPGHDQVRWPVADGGDGEPEEDELPPLSITSRRKGPRLFPLLLGTLFVLVLGAAGYYLVQGGAGSLLGMIPKGVMQLVGEGGKSQAVAVRSLEGEFVSNSEAGELFVMRGEVFNSSGNPITSLQVKGTVYGPNGEALAQRTVFCGNTLSREQLALQPYSSMEKVMGRQFGDTLANLEIPPGTAVPFMIVFRDLPKGATDFGAVVFEAAGR